MYSFATHFMQYAIKIYNTTDEYMMYSISRSADNGL